MHGTHTAMQCKALVAQGKSLATISRNRMCSESEAGRLLVSQSVLAPDSTLPERATLPQLLLLDARTAPVLDVAASSCAVIEYLCSVDDMNGFSYICR
eukprot:6175288-Pleurochrysis_carterae.AAC.4